MSQSDLFGRLNEWRMVDDDLFGRHSVNILSGTMPVESLVRLTHKDTLLNDEVSGTLHTALFLFFSYYYMNRWQYTPIFLI